MRHILRKEDSPAKPRCMQEINSRNIKMVYICGNESAPHNEKLPRQDYPVRYMDDFPCKPLKRDRESLLASVARHGCRDAPLKFKHGSAPPPSLPPPVDPPKPAEPSQPLNFVSPPPERHAHPHPQPPSTAAVAPPFPVLPSDHSSHRRVRLLPLSTPIGRASREVAGVIGNPRWAAGLVSASRVSGRRKKETCQQAPSPRTPPGSHSRPAPLRHVRLVETYSPEYAFPSLKRLPSLLQIRIRFPLGSGACLKKSFYRLVPGLRRAITFCSRLQLSPLWERTVSGESFRGFTAPLPEVPFIPRQATTTICMIAMQ
ncbi:uncharacterized protein [Triticum aestivum]|uniref:uncharacterized protein n=1 Tax=Triticum aestivum TaxID=4565 RepID=UPI001D02FFA3|nr:uncharacterized protein LOC123120504 [Triticum aestivum]